MAEPLLDDLEVSATCRTQPARIPHRLIAELTTLATATTVTKRRAR